MKLYVGIGFVLFVGLFLGVFGTFVCMSGTPPVAADCPGPRGTPCANGDVNADGNIDIGDPIYLLARLFARGPVPVAIECPPCPNGGLPATGQTLCYDANGAVIDCTSTDFPGQDGFYQKGCPTAGRFVDNRDGTVTDTCTGLMWQKGAGDRNGDTFADLMTWQEALQYCHALELAGHADWRLPNIRELQSIVDHGRGPPRNDPIFGVMLSEGWSSTSLLRDTRNALVVSFAPDGLAYSRGKNAVPSMVRAVRDAK